MSNEIGLILSGFPNLDRTKLQITSPATSKYNCVAFAAGDMTRWWWPAGHSYWPDGVIRAVRIPAFQMAFETLGYSLCSDSSLEDGLEKVAFFHKNKQPKHAARQLSNGLWTSKLGQQFDIAHDLEGMQGEQYGEIALLMQRIA